MSQGVQVTILGQQYSFKSTTAESEIRRVADFVNHKLDEVMASGRAIDSLNATILALFNISAEFLALQQDAAGSSPVLDERLQQLVNKLEEACGENL